MSVKAKNAARLKRLKEKRSRKDSQQAQYNTWRDSGANKKSKRFMQKKKSAQKQNRLRNHVDGECGNYACKRCFPQLNDPLLAKLSSCLYSLRWRSPKQRMRLANWSA